jgi:hypothetical protein
MTACTTVTNGGFMPQARHGGIAVCSFATDGSKLDGTGLENEHIGQIHVALVGTLGAAEVKERLELVPSVPNDPPPGDLGISLLAETLCASEKCFAALG